MRGAHEDMTARGLQQAILSAFSSQHTTLTRAGWSPDRW